MIIKLPRWDKDSILTHADMNRITEAIEWLASFQVDGGAGLQLLATPAGRTLSLVGGEIPIGFIKLTTALPAGDGINTLGHGQGQLFDFKAGTPGGSDSGKLSVSSGAATVDVYSLPNGLIKNGSTIIAFKMADGSWHYLFTICSNGG